MATSTPAGLTSKGPVRRRRVTRKRVLLGTLLLFAIVAGTYGVRLSLSLANITHENPLAAIHDIVKGKGGSAVQQEIDGLRRINVAVYGYGGPPHDSPYLTDSILIVSIQPQRGAPPQISEVSVPRDWFVPIQVDGKTIEQARVNQAYSDGVTGATHLRPGTDSGAKVAAATLEKVLGIPINHFVGVDFTAFQSGVDAVGGVDVDVATSFTDNQYPRGECGTDGSGDCSYKTVHFSAGTQHMDGAAALIFTRSRHSTDPAEGTDFARSRRQQLVVQALKQKVVSVGGLAHLPDLLNALSDHLATDLKIGDAEALYDLVKGVDRAQIARVSIDDTNFLYDCGFPANCPASYLYAHDTTYQSLSNFMNHVIPSPAAIAEHAPIMVVDGSGTGVGASTRWSALFHSIGYAATDGGQTRSQPATRVVDQSGGHYPQTAQWLSEYFGVTPEPVTGTASPPAAGAGGVLLVVGGDEERLFSRSSGEPSPADAVGSSPTPSATSSPSARRRPAGADSPAPATGSNPTTPAGTPDVPPSGPPPSHSAEPSTTPSTAPAMSPSAAASPHAGTSSPPPPG